MGTSKINRNIFLGLLAIVLALAIIGSSYLVNYQYRRLQCRTRFNEIKSIIPENQIITLTFLRTEILHWEKINKELEWKDKLYDVIEIKYSNSHIILRCVEDRTENDLVSAFRNLFKCRRDLDNDPGSFSFHHMKYVLPIGLALNIFEYREHQDLTYFEFHFGLKTTETASPPPDRKHLTASPV